MYGSLQYAFASCLARMALVPCHSARRGRASSGTPQDEIGEVVQASLIQACWNLIVGVREGQDTLGVWLNKAADILKAK